MNNAVKNFDILATSLSDLQSYFKWSNKILSDLYLKFYFTLILQQNYARIMFLLRMWKSNLTDNERERSILLKFSRRTRKREKLIFLTLKINSLEFFLKSEVDLVGGDRSICRQVFLLECYTRTSR